VVAAAFGVWRIFVPAILAIKSLIFGYWLHVEIIAELNLEDNECLLDVKSSSLKIISFMVFYKPNSEGVREVDWSGPDACNCGRHSDLGIFGDVVPGGYDGKSSEEVLVGGIKSDVRACVVDTNGPISPNEEHIREYGVPLDGA